MSQLIRVCEGCDCTDDNACFDPATGGPCFWVEGLIGSICSVCARALLGMSEAGHLHTDMADGEFQAMLNAALKRGLTASAGEEDDAGDADDGDYWAAARDAKDANRPLVELATEGDANRVIAELRRGGQA